MVAGRTGAPREPMATIGADAMLEDGDRRRERTGHPAARVPRAAGARVRAWPRTGTALLQKRLPGAPLVAVPTEAGVVAAVGGGEIPDQVEAYAGARPPFLARVGADTARPDGGGARLLRHRVPFWA